MNDIMIIIKVPNFVLAREQSLLLKEFPISFTVARFPIGYLSFLFTTCILISVFYEYIYSRLIYHLENKHEIKIQKTETKFSDIIG